jgi:hypothetical protein
VGQDIFESIGDVSGKYAVFAFLVIDDNGTVCMGDKKEGCGGWNPTNGSAEGGRYGTLGSRC